jgi:hypothetical protein
VRQPPRPKVWRHVVQRLEGIAQRSVRH